MAVYGLGMLGGGIAAYAKAQSSKSLIAGIVSALLLAAACILSTKRPRLGYGIGVAVAIGLVIVFVIRIQELLAQTPPGKIGGNIGLCALSACVATFLVYMFRQSPRQATSQSSL